MGWIVFEALFALAVMLAAAWWTFGTRRDPGQDSELPDEPAPRGGREDGGGSADRR